ncbi:hypothetical protein G6F70_009156 [Rhizopus microsporus]|uniref:RRM domain-containing protein n=2 Tax=Rhizopus TaxID=4842 RepID=A0A0A1P4Q3_RHIZD|nr:hypothetical protein G6F71_009212 [Rhizopus microsporus]KAG1192846.1 hypothetical protein G6F70_009156 [Rhizopus microsporus]KAG1206013.1 hypothetical protein G6F69_009135 [Rhizopus microsporus]KAG1227210.1 hypothetical protein G6F67_008584 [Rhizopus microsporus]KAG1256416.1 hypothetical protein G6F68_009799 [Rhizopus microsporus]
MASLRLIVPILSRQRPAFSICARSFTTSAIRFETNEHRHFAETFTNKLIKQAKRQYQPQKVEPTRLVSIESLPRTATSEDIRKLAREAFPKGDKSIVDMVFCRRPNFTFTGKCVVLMSSDEDAGRLVSYGDRRSLGGSIIRMSYTGLPNQDPVGVLNQLRPQELKSVAEATSAAGRSVMISGYPFTGIDNLLGYLRSKNFYPVDGVPDSVVNLSERRFLVKFDSESEAWRCVRAFHNEKYITKRNSEHTIRVDVVY